MLGIDLRVVRDFPALAPFPWIIPAWALGGIAVEDIDAGVGGTDAGLQFWLISPKHFATQK
jgi:hypothetical protein